MKQLPEALTKALSVCDDEGMNAALEAALVRIGWTPPKKPDPPRKPVRAWATDLLDGQRIYRGEWGTLPAGGKVHELIEAGYCKMVPHDGSNACPVDPELRVAYVTSWNHGNQKGGDINWEYITHYAVILEVE